MVDRLIRAGHWRDGDPEILIVCDTGYDVARLAFVLADLPVRLLGRIRTDRVLRLPKPPRTAGAAGRPPKHGPEFRLADPAASPPPASVEPSGTSAPKALYQPVHRNPHHQGPDARPAPRTAYAHTATTSGKPPSAT
ncbi:transposase [Polymorphospora lycopeni]|uniref:Transposase n=1 Tax=Polymorphospora lycopeni TaxID=3140240 RepID=A0ABV5CNI6_9ACTN